MMTSRLFVDPAYGAMVDTDLWALQFARIEWYLRATDMMAEYKNL